MSFSCKIAITGPESTGKSRLAAGLGSYFDAAFVPEYARGYLDGLGRPYEQHDLLQIARGQLLATEKIFKQGPKLLFSDTELIVIKVWSLHKYGSCHPFILNSIEKQDYCLYLLCDIDLPWEYDPLREHPHLRGFFFNWYQKELEYYGFPFVVISGRDEMRMKNAVEAVENLLLRHKEPSLKDNPGFG